MSKRLILSKKDKITNLHQASKKSYSSISDYEHHKIEQYKLAVEMADRISARRKHANSFFITANASLVGAITALKNNFSSIFGLWDIVVVLVVLLGLCGLWRKKINSYRQLNDAKYQIIWEMEKDLPFAIYEREWKLLEENKKGYYSLSQIEKQVPILFIVVYLVIIGPTIWEKIITGIQTFQKMYLCLSLSNEK